MRTQSRKFHRQDSQFWVDHNKAWGKSGLSQADYCQRHGLSFSSFRYWRSKLTNRKSGLDGEETSSSAQAVAIVPVPMQPHAKAKPPERALSQGALQVQVGNGYKIEVHGDFAAPALCKLVRALERLG